MDETIQKLNETLIDEFEVEEVAIRPDADFKETLDLDSLDYVDLVVAIDSVAGVRLGEEDFMKVTDFQSFYDIIEEKITAKKAEA